MTAVGQHTRHRYRVIASFVDELTCAAAAVVVAVHSDAQNARLPPCTGGALSTTEADSWYPVTDYRNPILPRMFCCLLFRGTIASCAQLRPPDADVGAMPDATASCC